MHKKPIISIDIIIQDNQKRILLGRLARKWQNGGKYLWGLPGREIFFGEKLKDCIIRNLKEEIGMRFISARIVSINSNFENRDHYITIGILAEVKDNPINNKPEDWSEWRWFNKKKIPSKLFPSAKLTLESFFKNKITLDL